MVRKRDKSKPKGKAKPAVVPEASEPKVWLRELLSLRLSGSHLTDGIDPGEHIRQLRQDWD